MRHGKRLKDSIVAVSGGPDSVFLLLAESMRGAPLAIAHFDHRARGRHSDADRSFVEDLGRELGIPVEVGMARRAGGTDPKAAAARFEETARKERYAFLFDVLRRRRAHRLLVAHTADDQVETVLMRIFEGAGISGLKGIPRRTADGVERPLLDTFREEIVAHLRAERISFRTDRSNEDTRFERNWIRAVLLPLLEKRYGKTVRKRIHALGERFREIDEFLEISARKALKVQLKAARARGGLSRDRTAVSLPRRRFSRQAAAVRKKALQLVCFERLGIAPNERLLEAMDRIIGSGGPSARLSLGGGAALYCRYDEAVLEAGATRAEPRRAGRARKLRIEGPGRHELPPGGPWREGESIVVENGKRMAAAAVRRMSAGERRALFDAELLELPLCVRPLRAGDRMRPFGLDGEKKVKEILIDRKVPRDERWGRPAVCDAAGAIVWIPGVVRSSHAPVTARTARTLLLGIDGRSGRRRTRAGS